MEKQDVPALALKAGARLAAGLRTLPGVVDVRGLGLLLGAELADGIDAKAVASAALNAGLVVNAITPTALRLAPPLLVSDAEIDEALSILETLLKNWEYPT